MKRLFSRLDKSRHTAKNTHLKVPHIFCLTHLSCYVITRWHWTLKHSEITETRSFNHKLMFRITTGTCCREEECKIWAPAAHCALSPLSFIQHCVSPTSDLTLSVRHKLWLNESVVHLLDQHSSKIRNFFACLAISQPFLGHFFSVIYIL